MHGPYWEAYQEILEKLPMHLKAKVAHSDANQFKMIEIELIKSEFEVQEYSN